MSWRVARYAIVAGLSAAVAGAFFGVGEPIRCGLYGCSAGGGHSTQTFLLALAIGAVVGLAAAAVADLMINGRYALANRAEARRRRRARLDQPPPPSP